MSRSSSGARSTRRSAYSWTSRSTSVGANDVRPATASLMLNVMEIALRPAWRSSLRCSLLAGKQLPKWIRVTAGVLVVPAQR